MEDVGLIYSYYTAERVLCLQDRDRLTLASVPYVFAAQLLNKIIAFSPEIL